MDLESWRPFKDLASLREEINRVFDRVFKERPEEFFRGGAVNPPIDLSETPDSIIVRAEIPGIDANDVSVSITGDTLTIKGEKKQEKEDPNENYHQVERTYGPFSRSVRIPVQVQTDKVTASYKKGILHITLPKVPEAKSQTIKINVEG
jgi:HSP20 family protein